MDVQVTATPKHPRASAARLANVANAWAHGSRDCQPQHQPHPSIPLCFTPARLKRAVYDDDERATASEELIPSSAVRPATSQRQPDISSVANDGLRVVGGSRAVFNDGDGDGTVQAIASSPPIAQVQMRGDSTVEREGYVEAVQATPSRKPLARYSYPPLVRTLDRINPLSSSISSSAVINTATTTTAPTDSTLSTSTITLDASICPDTPAAKSTATTNIQKPKLEAIHRHAFRHNHATAQAKDTKPRRTVLSTRRDAGNARIADVRLRKGGGESGAPTAGMFGTAGMISMDGTASTAIVTTPGESELEEYFAAETPSVRRGGYAKVGGAVDGLGSSAGVEKGGNGSSGSNAWGRKDWYKVEAKRARLAGVVVGRSTVAGTAVSTAGNTITVTATTTTSSATATTIATTGATATAGIDTPDGFYDVPAARIQKSANTGTSGNDYGEDKGDGGFCAVGLAEEKSIYEALGWE